MQDSRPEIAVPMIQLRPFQKRFLHEITRPNGPNTAAISAPRGSGKSTFCGIILHKALDPRSDLFVGNGKECVINAASLTQCRIVYRVIRGIIMEQKREKEYSFIDSAQRICITHKATNARLLAHSSTGKTLFGLMDTRFLVLDEPGALDLKAGERLWSAVKFSQGKLDSPLTTILIGHLAPNAVRAGHWYHDLVMRGTYGSTYVQHYQGDLENWDNWHKSIMPANPLLRGNRALRDAIMEEREEARNCDIKKAEFLAYRLNLPSRPDNRVLLQVNEWKKVRERKLAPRKGKPIVGVDVGGNRAWTTAVAVWRSGRIEAFALAPGTPSIAAQEKRDNVPKGAYSRIENLIIAEGLNVPPLSMLWEEIKRRWGAPARVVCDRFRLGELRDALPASIYIEPRVGKWSESTADIRSFKSLCLDGNANVEPASRSLIEASLSVATIEYDSSGNIRMVKEGSMNKARDDVCSAWVLAS